MPSSTRVPRSSGGIDDDFRDNFVGDNLLNRAGQAITNARAHDIVRYLTSAKASAATSKLPPPYLVVNIALVFERLNRIASRNRTRELPTFT